ncbi:MAG TPA: hypothetical protein O0X70_01590 [Methanocorpusculum sp.]|nr:hypothetical protein [Methanocorpusculum sp.]
MLTIDDSNRPRGPLDFDEDRFVRDYSITYAFLVKETEKTIQLMNELKQNKC